MVEYAVALIRAPGEENDNWEGGSEGKGEWRGLRDQGGGREQEVRAGATMQTGARL